MTTDDTVFVTVNGKVSRSRKPYHIDRDCSHIGATITEITRATARRSDMDPCSACATDQTGSTNGGGSRDLLEAIQRHVKNERGEDPYSDMQGMGEVSDE